MAGILTYFLHQYYVLALLVVPYGASSGKYERVRISCSSGFWGDTSESTPQLVRYGDLVFLVADYLSEITMSLLAGAKRKKPDMSYTPDFISHCIKPLIHDIKKQGICVVTNGGGINPEGCVNTIIKRHVI
uniref:Acyclic terpene utilisation N-terminal domain-containing protein n=1 Tax=Amphimedon queenslandica TaxID=400682 RepID=A0A1X7SZP2_AMPQE